MKKIIISSILAAATCLSAGAEGFSNPIIPGFYPDPSICRADSDYYIVNSSFEYFPGVPIFHSRDLINWRQLGYVLDRESQLKIKGGNMWGGIYAPTIRYNDGVFYMVTTNNTDRGNFLVHTTDPKSGKWSDPVWLTQKGIDPSLYFEDGRCYMVSNPDDAIWLCEIDPMTGKQLTESKIIWRGTGGRYPEGPHIYRHGGWYYLMISEGGTEYGHKVTIARSKKIDGPYEANPANPILTHINQNAQTNPIQGVGHPDMVEAPDGSWWLVCLAFRPTGGQHHILGRETFLAPVKWSDEGWPVVNGDGTISLEMPECGLPAKAESSGTLNTDRDFNDSKLGLEWNWLGNYEKEDYSLSERPGHLRIKGSKLTLDNPGSPSFVGRRQQHFDFTATTEVETNGAVSAGITAYLWPEAHYELYVKEGRLLLRYRIGLLLHEEEVCKLPSDSAYLRISGNEDYYTFAYSTDGVNFSEAGIMNMRYLSSETNGGFTGVYIGLFAEGEGYADFDFFDYQEK